MLARRRALGFIVIVGTGFLSLVTRAQPPAKPPRIGVTVAGHAPNPYVDALRRGLSELGWMEGHNFSAEYRYTEGRSDRLPELIAELVDLKVDLIVAGGGGLAVRSAMQSTKTIPIVMPAITDPVAAGYVSSLSRPGGNVTGQSMLDTEIGAKRMELLKALLPNAQRVAALLDTRSVPAQRDAMEAAVVSAAESLGVRLQVLRLSHPDEYGRAFAAATAAGAEALIVLPSGGFTANRRRLVELAAQNWLAAIYEHGDFVEAGGLISYGINLREMWYRTARYVDKILKGTKPADLPVEQPSAFELVINAKTARTLQLTIPKALLVRADRIIDD